MNQWTNSVCVFTEKLRHPISLDVFESSLYWLTKDTGELKKHDKFNRGVPVTISKDLVNPSGVKGKKLYQCLKHSVAFANPFF